MITNMKTLAKSLLLVSMITTLSWSAQTYDDLYRPSKDFNSSVEKNFSMFMHGNFAEIVRFEPIQFSGGVIDDNATEVLDTALEKIHSYIDDGKEIKVTVIGHTRRVTDDMNELTIDSDTYANHFQNLFRTSFDTNESNETSLDYAKNIEEKLLDDNISKEILYVENRLGNDLAYTDSVDEGIDLSNRVMLTMYVLGNLKKDSDKDGVFDKFDKCPDTPIGVAVDEQGCPLDSDHDGVYDYMDECPQTPVGVAVDKVGCPFDSDKDGVLDYKDACPGTLEGLEVDENGCAHKRTLALNFDTGSYEIQENSYPEITKFAEFMKKNERYNIEIVGHTDSVGKEFDNMLLSQNRAIATKKALVAEGISEERIATLGRGETEPIQSNATKEGRAANRRIVVELFYK